MSKHNSDVSKFHDPASNPCIAEQKETIVCFEKNHYNQDKCRVEVLNYRDCKTFWHEISKKRRENNIQPYLPGEKERKQIIEFVGDNLPYVAL